MGSSVLVHSDENVSSDSGPLTMGQDETWSCGESIIYLSYLCLCHSLLWQLETRGSYMV